MNFIPLCLHQIRDLTLNVTYFRVWSNEIVAQDRVILILAQWSGVSIANCIETLRFLNKKGLFEKVVVLESDSLSTEQHLEIFGVLCEGWGEIYLIKDGKVSLSFMGKNSASLFKQYYTC